MARDRDEYAHTAAEQREAEDQMRAVSIWPPCMGPAGLIARAIFESILPLAVGAYGDLSAFESKGAPQETHSR